MQRHNNALQPDRQTAARFACRCAQALVWPIQRKTAVQQSDLERLSHLRSIAGSQRSLTAQIESEERLLHTRYGRSRWQGRMTGT